MNFVYPKNAVVMNRLKNSALTEIIKMLAIKKSNFYIISGESNKKTNGANVEQWTIIAKNGNVEELFLLLFYSFSWAKAQRISLSSTIKPYREGERDKHAKICSAYFTFVKTNSATASDSTV